MLYNTFNNLIYWFICHYFADMITNPFTLIPGINKKVVEELKEIDRRLEFLNNIKIIHHEKIRP